MEMYYTKSEYNQMVQKYERQIKQLNKKIDRLEKKILTIQTEGINEVFGVTEESDSNE